MGSSASRSSSRQGESGQTEALKKRILQKEIEILALKTTQKRNEKEIQSLKTTIERLQIEQQNIAKPIPSSQNNSSPWLAPQDVIAPADVPQVNLPKIGDHVVSMWGASKWQYFTATIRKFDKATLKYTIEWDDHDPTGLIVDYFNLALDKIPPEDQIGVGSKVLFHQGKYTQQNVEGGILRSGGLRWHQGEITKIWKGPGGVKNYNGRHTKGAVDGKWITYKDYSEEFTDYKIDDFRMPPNVFDILDSVSDGELLTENTTSEDEIEVFISYAKINSPSAIKNKEIVGSDVPPSYSEVMLEDLCDPREIVKQLESVGVRVYFNEDYDDSSLLEIVSVLKRTRVFIACLSDEYASNDRCRMEFQYAKKTLKIPVIPLVVGSGSFQWKMTVVGLLIAGELYIHFKDKSVQGFKMNELLRSIKKHIPSLQLKNTQYSATGDSTLDLITTPGLTVTGARIETGPADIFFSYCWSNSYYAEKSHQIRKAIGTEWNDPRVIENKLREATGATTWIDITRLESAADGMGMFGQIATAIGECNIVVACVSNEYAASDNCRMELQFAATSLQKSIIVVVVGEGNEWEQTVVGKIALLGTPVVNIQGISSNEDLDKKIMEIKDHIGDKIELNAPQAKPKKLEKRESVISFKAPKLGDHVVCLHQGWGYFTATVMDFDSTDLIYTVDWDDGDPTGRVQSYKDVALDLVPDSRQIGVGSIVIFPQGSYSGTEGNNTGGHRYHQGKITSIHTDGAGITRYDGVHTKGEEDGKWINWRDYNPVFRDYHIEDLRISPNAMDALMACKQAFNLTD